ncbi:hypothetical protein BV341_05753 [Pseudomonas syringae pv. actinidiae]|nr:hypothetical protein BV341_05753 [Pseudomonas syringae pv. actinidiae]
MLAKSCSSITPGKQRRSSTGKPARSVRRRSSALSSAPPATPLPRPPGRRNCPTGWARTSDALLFSAAQRRYWYQTICAAALPKLIVTNPTSTPVTATWPSITASPSCLLARASPRTKPRSKSVFKWSSAGSWRCCATASSSRSANSTQPSRYCWIASTTSPSKSCPARAGQPSRPSTNRRCKRYRSIRTSTPNGKKYASISTITLRSMATFTRCRTSW